MNVLTINEATLLTAVWRLKENAYGVKVKKHVSEITEKEWNYGTLYCMLDQLASKGFLSKQTGDPSPERGGRRKIFYSLTKEGLKALKGAYKLHMALWQGVSDVAFDEGKVS
ncbi:MAG: PadR family transcriptional regulator [bacterium]|nr:PadR family transcriptional regulator [bacterium]